MKKFKFRLQKLLDIRESQEKEIKNELSKAVSEQNVFRAKQNELKDKITGLKEDLHDKLKSKEFDFNNVKLFYNFESFTDKVIIDTNKKIKELEPGINKIKQRLIEATKQRRVIEKLKEKRKNEWEYLVQRADTKENDDMNQKIFMRKLNNFDEEVYDD